MFHLRDIQKLRNNRNGPSYYQTWVRMTPPQQLQGYHININRVIDGDASRIYNQKLNETQNKVTSIRELKNHRRGFSHALPLSDRKQYDGVSEGVIMYNFPTRMSERSSHCLTARKEKPQQLIDIELMPQNELREDKKIQESICMIKITQKLNKGSFNILYPIGKGGFGKVWKVQYKKTNEILAMKQMYKSKIIKKKLINSVINQQILLSKLKNTFIINMVAAFQDRQNLYLLMDYINGGDLRYHIGRKRKFNQKQTKFFLANIIIGLQYLHKNKIIHRDIKPENMVFDSDGYLRITDLGISRELRDDNHQDTSGTPGYMAPEVICRKNHSYTADYFAVGVMGYQFITGRRPYVGKNRKQIRDQIIAKQAMIKTQQLPSKWNVQAADFINRLLMRNPNNRLGFNGIQQIKNHPWMVTIDWKKLAKKQIKAPYIPLSIEQNYEDYKNQISQDSVDEHLQQNLLMLRNKEVQALFEDYYYDGLESEHKKTFSYTTTSHSVNSCSSSTIS